MTATHTAGPWANCDGDITGVENDPANGCVGPVDVAHVYLRTVPGRSEANASLISAAPDLLEALEEITADYSGRFDLDSPSTNPGIKTSIARARAAISKAKGQS